MNKFTIMLNGKTLSTEAVSITITKNNRRVVIDTSQARFFEGDKQVGGRVESACKNEEIELFLNTGSLFSGT